MLPEVHVIRLGRMSYAPAWDLQRQLQAELITAKRSGITGDAAPSHKLLIVEHPPVFTLGKNGSDTHLLASAELLKSRGAEYVEVDRGGDITFHGPGQLVAYPILDLDRITYSDGKKGTDIHKYLRELEEAVIGVAAEYGISSDRVEGRTGVWVNADERGPERKICAMGIRCSRWVTMHGIALNATTDLTYFDLIVPCGITDRGVTSLEKEIGQHVDLDIVSNQFLRHFADRFDVHLTELPEGQSFVAPATVSANFPEAAVAQL